MFCLYRAWVTEEIIKKRIITPATSAPTSGLTYMLSFLHRKKYTINSHSA